jgi:CRP-like cAMP-binding protein
MTHTPTQNHLIAALPVPDFERLAPALELVPLPLGEPLFDAGNPAEHVYFPTTAVVSLLGDTVDGALAEIAVVGNEGIVGISQLLVGAIAPSRAVVQSAGLAYRLKARVMQQEYNSGGPVLRLMLRYAKVLTSQMEHTAACQRQHSVEQQLCRMLLLSLDRSPSSSLAITQELSATLLGAGREGVMQAAVSLQRAGLISNRRGHIEVLDRSGLKMAVCGCYSAVKAEVDRLFSDIGRADAAALAA